MAANMLSNILHNASGGTVRGTAAWGKPGTTNVCVLTLTSWILCPPGRNVDVFTFRRSCAAPACCSILRTSLLVQVSHKYSVQLLLYDFSDVNVPLFCYYILLYYSKVQITVSIVPKCFCRWAYSLGLPVRPPVSAGALAFSWLCALGFETC